MFKLYPLIDGEVHAFVEDVIDQQRYINRLITMIDFIMGSSAKGVLLFPEDQIPDGMTIDDIADEWTKYNGIILFRPRPGSPMPQQIAVNATQVGAYEMLSLQMRLFEDISGVHGAMQGRLLRRELPPRSTRNRYNTRRPTCSTSSSRSRPSARTATSKS